MYFKLQLQLFSKTASLQYTPEQLLQMLFAHYFENSKNHYYDIKKVIRFSRVLSKALSIDFFSKFLYHGLMRTILTAVSKNVFIEVLFFSGFSRALPPRKFAPPVRVRVWFSGKKGI